MKPNAKIPLFVRFQSSTLHLSRSMPPKKKTKKATTTTRSTEDDDGGGGGGDVDVAVAVKKKKRAKSPSPLVKEDESEEENNNNINALNTNAKRKSTARRGKSQTPNDEDDDGGKEAEEKKVSTTSQNIVLEEAKRNLVLESGNKVSLTPLLGGIREDDGAQGGTTTTTEPLCYLLQIDQTNILLDCGWDDRFDQTEYVKELEKIAPTLDCVLISHCTQRHVGAVPLLFSERVKCNPNCKIYASIPTHKLGQMLCYDIALGYSEFRGEFGEDVGYSLDDVDLAFSKFVPVKYQQHSRVSVSRESAGGVVNESDAGNNSKNSGGATNSDIVVEAINAGHTLGGSCWRISKDAEDIVYAVDYNMRKERHLAGTSLAETVHRPSVLITDCRNVDRKAPESRLQVRDLPLVDCVLKHARMEGNVVICCDAVGRTLELALLLEETWKNQNLGSYQLVLFNNVAANALEFARSHLEWMNEDVGLKFDSTRQNVFDVKRLFPCHSYEDFTRLPPGPKVVLASLASLEGGFARKLFVEWAWDAKNCFIWPDEIGRQVGLAREIVEKCSKGGAKTTSSKTKKKDVIMKVELARRESLSGKELEAWEHEQEEKRLEAEKRREEEAKRLAEEEEKKRMLEEEMDVDAATLSQPVEDEDIYGEKKAGVAEEEEKVERLVPPPQVNEETGIALRDKQMSFERRECIVDGFIPESFEHLVFPDETKLSSSSSDPSGMSAKTEYGEAIDADAFFRVANELRPEMTRDQSFESTGDVDKLASVDDSMDATIGIAAKLTNKQPDMDIDANAGKEEKALERPVGIPTKVVKETKEIVVKAAIESNFDYDGLADGRSVKAIIPRLEPRRVILVSGTVKDAEKLASHLYNDSEHFPKSSKIDYPKNNETLDASSVHPTYKVRLSEAVLSSARLRQVSGYAVGWIDGVIGPIPEDGSAPELLPVPVNALKLTVSKTVKDESLLAGKVTGPSLVKKETTAAALVVEDNEENEGTEINIVTKHHRRSAFVGDVRLSEFRRYLQRMGVPAEFGEGGALVCANGQVVVRRRAEDDELIVEGSISDAYFNVRDMLYAQYSII